MAQFLMSEFLGTVTADYAYTLTVAPNDGMSIQPLKTQIILYTDDNTPLVRNINENTKFKVQLTWEKLSLADAEIIMELWTDTSKANGAENSFRWTNPGDTKTYVVKFITMPSLKHFAINRQTVDNVELLVMGNYVP